MEKVKNYKSSIDICEGSASVQQIGIFKGFEHLHLHNKFKSPKRKGWA